MAMILLKTKQIISCILIGHKQRDIPSDWAHKQRQQNCDCYEKRDHLGPSILVYSMLVVLYKLCSVVYM